MSYIKDQPQASSVSAGDFFVFDTASGTWKITRQALLGQMDLNKNNIVTLSGNFSTVQSQVGLNTLQIDANLAAIDKILRGEVLYGLRFDGTTYMNLGVVPLLFSEDSYIKFRYKAEWQTNDSIFGYQNSGTDRFYLTRTVTQDKLAFQIDSENVMSTKYPAKYQFQEVYIFVNNWNGGINPTLNVLIGGDLIYEDLPFTPREYSGIDFYLGARNNGGPFNLTFSEWESAEFFNGGEKKIYNHSNSWNGAQNNGGTLIYSLNNGVSWQ